MKETRICFIGSGNMASSLVIGFYQQGFKHITVSSPNSLQKDFLKPYAKLTINNKEAVKTADLIVLAVKPPLFKTVSQDINPNLKKEALIISVAAGISIKNLENLFPNNQFFIRAMPNTPCRINQGVTALFASQNVSANHKDLLSKLFSSLGLSVWLEDENLMHTATALCGSGPAYLFLFLQAMQEAAINLGLEPSIAKQLTLKMAQGTIELAAKSQTTFSELQKTVTSKGGTTEAAINHLNKNNITAIIKDAMMASFERSRALTLTDSKGENNESAL